MKMPAKSLIFVLELKSLVPVLEPRVLVNIAAGLQQAHYRITTVAYDHIDQSVCLPVGR